MQSSISVVVLWYFLGNVSGSSFLGQVDYLGCYNELDLPRHFPNRHILNPFVADHCFKLCFGQNYLHAGLDSERLLCYCGEDILNHISKVEDSQCKPCEHDLNFCGGVHKLSLYKIEASAKPKSVNEGNQETKTDPKFGEEPVILLAGDGGIYMYNTSVPKLQTLIKVDYQVDAIDYDIFNQEGYAIWDDRIYRFPLFGDSENDKKVVGSVNRCPTFALDWVHRRIYWPDCYYHAIMALDMESKNDDPQDTLTILPEGAWAMDMVVDPYKGLLFWTTGATLMSCRLDGRGIRKIVPEFPVNRVSTLSLDFDNERIYFSGGDKKDKNSTRLYFSTYEGSVSFPLQFHEYEGGSHILTFAIFKSFIYFIKGTVNHSSMVVVNKLEHNQRPIVYLQEKDVQVNRIRLVHPQLQSPATENVCTTHGCSHLCLIESLQPQCYCPRYYELDGDNKTCFLNPGEEEKMPLLVRVAFGLMLVLIVVLGAGVLMCLFDKLWSEIHPTVVSLSMPGAAKTSFTGHRMQDGENLI